MGKPVVTLVVAVLSVLTALSASATVLTFDGSGLTNYGPIPVTYGDRVTATDDIANGFQYLQGNGFTPNVVVDYNPSLESFSLWPNGYGDLENALGHVYYDVSGEVVLTPDPGYVVVLNSFDVAAWITAQDNVSPGVFPGSRVEVRDGFDAVLFDSGLFEASYAAGRYSFTPSLTSAEPLRILISNYGNLALDNVDFDQMESNTAVPEPASLLLLGSGLVAVALRRRRRV